MSNLFKLKLTYCVPMCEHNADKCPILPLYNRFFCAWCGATIDEEVERKSKTIPTLYHGGLIFVLTEKLMKYTFACKCRIGEIWQRLDTRYGKGVQAFDFHDDTRCYVQRSLDLCKFKTDILKAWYPERYKENGKKGIEITTGTEKKTTSLVNSVKQMFNAEEIR